MGGWATDCVIWGGLCTRVCETGEGCDVVQQGVWFLGGGSQHWGSHVGVWVWRGSAPQLHLFWGVLCTEATPSRSRV